MHAWVVVVGLVDCIHREPAVDNRPSKALVDRAAWTVPTLFALDRAADSDRIARSSSEIFRGEARRRKYGQMQHPVVGLSDLFVGERHSHCHSLDRAAGCSLPYRWQADVGEVVGSPKTPSMKPSEDECGVRCTEWWFRWQTNELQDLKTKYCEAGRVVPQDLVVFGGYETRLGRMRGSMCSYSSLGQKACR